MTNRLQNTRNYLKKFVPSKLEAFYEREKYICAYCFILRALRNSIFMENLWIFAMNFIHGVWNFAQFVR